MKKLKHLALGLCAIAALATGSSCNSSGGSGSSAPVELKMNFKAGDKYLYTTQINQNIGMAQGLSMAQNITMEMLYTCTGDEAGNKNLQITYQHILMEVQSPVGSMKYDSGNPSSGSDMTGLGIMDSLIGKSFGLTVAPDGNITKVSGLEEILASFQQNDADVMAGIHSQLSDTAIRMMMQNSFDMYPGHPVKIGDTWNKKMRMTFSGVQVNVDNTYALKSVDGGKATLSLTSILNLPSTGMGAATENAQMELSGKQDGTIELDVASGQVLSSNINSDIKGKMTMSGNPQDVNIKGVINVSSKKQ